MSAALRLRPTVADDMMLYFMWVNDPAVRAGAFQSAAIPLATHRAWFARALADADVSMWVLLADDVPVGQVRLTFAEASAVTAGQRAAREALIDYSVAAAARGHGYGCAMLALVEQELPAGTMLVGQVKEENSASRRTFLALGYQERRVENGTFWEYRKHIV